MLHDEWHVEDTFVDATVTMTDHTRVVANSTLFAEPLTVVGRDHDKGVIQFTLIAECFYDSPESIIHTTNRAIIECLNRTPLAP